MLIVHFVGFLFLFLFSFFFFFVGTCPRTRPFGG